jgi:type IV pilus assembly protein PilB
MARPFSSGGKHSEKKTSTGDLRESGGVQVAERPANASRLGDLLVAGSALSPDALGDALNRQYGSGKRIGDLLVELGSVTEHAVAEALATQFQLPVVDLRTEQADVEAVGLLDEEIARGFGAAPLGACSDGSIAIAVADPDPAVRQQILAAAARPVTFFVSTPTDVRRSIDSTYQVLPGIAAQVAAFKATDGARTRSEQAGDETAADNVPVVQIVTMLLAQAVRDRASDIHIEPQDAAVRVRFRVDGALHDVMTLPETMGPGLASRLKIMAGMNIVERRRPQDGQISTEIDGRAIDLRVATTSTIWGEKVVLRVLDKTRQLRRLAELGMPADTYPTFAKIVRAPFGMVLCAGPTGSGKTTTLYATLAEINDVDRNVMTIEDPVEYTFPSINQMQMNEAAGVTFATGLKSILRQDPDIILVGEIRDVETARIAVQSALTGHLVLSSLHATDAVSALHRFLDMGIESFLIASSVVAIVGQRLVRRTCTHCKAPYIPNDEELAFYAASGGALKTDFYAGTGCNYCSGTGYRERIGVYELLRITPEIKRLVVGWATQEEIRRLAVSQGMRTLQDEALRLVEHDVTTISEVVRAIYAF